MQPGTPYCLINGATIFLQSSALEFLTASAVADIVTRAAPSSEAVWRVVRAHHAAPSFGLTSGDCWLAVDPTSKRLVATSRGGSSPFTVTNGSNGTLSLTAADGSAVRYASGAADGITVWIVDEGSAPAATVAPPADVVSPTVAPLPAGAPQVDAPTDVAPAASAGADTEYVRLVRPTDGHILCVVRVGGMRCGTFGGAPLPHGPNGPFGPHGPPHPFGLGGRHRHFGFGCKGRALWAPQGPDAVYGADVSGRDGSAPHRGGDRPACAFEVRFVAEAEAGWRSTFAKTNHSDGTVSLTCSGGRIALGHDDAHNVTAGVYDGAAPRLRFTPFEVVIADGSAASVTATQRAVMMTAAGEPLRVDGTSVVAVVVAAAAQHRGPFGRRGHHGMAQDPHLGVLRAMFAHRFGERHCRSGSSDGGHRGAHRHGHGDRPWHGHGGRHGHGRGGRHGRHAVIEGVTLRMRREGDVVRGDFELPVSALQAMLADVEQPAPAGTQDVAQVEGESSSDMLL